MIMLAADVGGTFTDLILVDAEKGRVLVDKVPTGRRGSARGIAPGLERIALRAGCRVSDIGLFVHGFTVATNAFLMRQGARAALVTSQGCGDVLDIGNQMRPRTYALIQQKPAPLIRRDRVVEVRERVDAFGAVVEHLSDEEIRRTVESLRQLQPESVAISLLFSYLNPAHETRLAEAIRSGLPDVEVYCSHDINPQLEEWPRASTTAMAAFVGPVVGRYIDELEQTLGEQGFAGSLQFMRSDGGVATPRAARENPGHMLTSGLAGGTTAAAKLCRDLGLKEAITLDVGGTSADLAAITGGEARTRMSRVIDGQPVRLPTIDVETISNGGGSIAWVDAGGALKIGPLSAGAVPGPACYGQGGTQPTVTDAAVVLGWLAPEDYLGGEVPIRPDLARKAVADHVAEPLGIALEEAAFGIIRVANAMLVQSIRALAVERGLDVREFHLVAFGGAGPIYGSMIARELGMRGVIVPRHPGVYAAEGLLAANIRHLAQLPFRSPIDRLDEAALRPKLEALREAVAHELDADGVPLERRSSRILGDLRYVGQFHEILVELSDASLDRMDRAGLSALFHQQHEANYGHHDPGAVVEIVNLRIEAVGHLDLPDFADAFAYGSTEVGPARHRAAVMSPGAAAVRVPVYDRAALALRQRIAGPAIISQMDSTTIVIEGQVAEAGPCGVLTIIEAGA